MVVSMMIVMLLTAAAGSADNTAVPTAAMTDVSVGRVLVTKDAVPQIMNLQGYLTDLAGNPIPDTSLQMSFKMLRGGSVKWQETQACSVKQGLFSVSMGSVTSIPESVFSPGAAVKLGLAVGTDTFPWIDMTSVGFAYRSVKSDTATYALASQFDSTWGDARYLNEGQSAGGDLSGTYANPWVDGLQGRGVPNIAPSTNQVLTWNGSGWVPSNVTVTRPISPPLSGSEIAKPCTLRATLASPGPLYVRNDGNGPAITLGRAGIYSGGYNGFPIIEVDSALQFIKARWLVGPVIDVDIIGRDGGILIDSCRDYGLDISAADEVAIFRCLDDHSGDYAISAHTLANNSSLTAIRAWGKGVASGGWSTGYLKGSQKEAPCVVSSERTIIAHGTGVVSQSKARIPLPDVLVQNSTKGGPVHVTVTPVGLPGGILYLSEVDADGFEVAVAGVSGLDGKIQTRFNWTAMCKLDIPTQGKDAKAEYAEYQRRRAERRDRKEAAERGPR
jgi:hypothetical protein